MSHSELDGTSPIGKSTTARRTIVKGAAWSIPVVAAAIAAPMAAASVNTASLAVTDTSTSLLALRVLDSASVITAQALVTVPTELTLTNGPGALSGAAVVTITVGKPGGLQIPLGSARGFGVASYDGVNSTAAERTATYTRVLGANVGFPATGFTKTTVVNVASNGSVQIPVVFGLAGTSTGVSIGVLLSFPVTVTMLIDGVTLTTTSTISVPVGAGIL